MRLPRPRQLRSPLARAVVPVGLGLLFFGVLALALWGVAAWLSNGNAKTSDLLATKSFVPGSASAYAQLVAEDGPILFPDLLGTDGDKTIVLDHRGSDPTTGWVIHLAHPADKPLSCKVVQIRHTRNFTDCDGRTITVDELAEPARGIRPDVSADGILSLDLVPDDAAPPTATTG
ncbi:MAG: hypothetical protein JWM12_1441 [Ilumatobacteraceae bacterium]|jgi:hypothetical protein|nr:hypothetical protein [Ilumatobacteraceae bacterium]